MPFRRVILLFISIVILALLFTVPFYKEWVGMRIWRIDEHEDIFYQSQHMGIEERKELRFGDSYVFYRGLGEQLRENNVNNVTMLLPPNDYVQEQGLQAMVIPEPAVFYYFTGINAVTHNSPNVQAANWALVASKNRVWMNSLRSKEQLDSLLVLYKPYNN